MRANLQRNLDSIPLNASTKSALREPALRVGTMYTAVAGIFSLVIQIWPNLLTDNQQQLVYVILALFAPIFTAFLIRRKVWSPASVVELVKEVAKEAEEAGAKAHTEKLQLLRNKIENSRQGIQFDKD